MRTFVSVAFRILCSAIVVGMAFGFLALISKIGQLEEIDRKNNIRECISRGGEPKFKGWDKVFDYCQPGF